jgi:hypothetical protein
MPLTSNCDLFVSVNEAGINQIVLHIMRQRPSLFNYGTDAVIRNPRLLCSPIDAAPAVIARGNPLITREPGLPVIATRPPVGLDFAIQLTQAQVDFAPGDTITLPAELTPPLPAQHLALHFQACAGLGCPSDEIIQAFQFQHPQPGQDVAGGPQRGGGSDGQIIVLPAVRLDCFCLDLYAIAHASLFATSGTAHLLAGVDGLDLVEIKPDGLENSLLCYLKIMLQLGILAGGFSYSHLTQTVTGLTVTVAPSPTSGALPFNPAIEEEQLKVFINVTPIVPSPTVVACPTSGGGGGGGPTRSIGWGAGPAAPPGPDHLIVAAAARLVSAMFAAVRNDFHPCFSLNKNLGPLTVQAAAGGHLENGTVTLANDGTITITDLALKWDTLRLSLGVSIPQICVGGFCIIPTPFGCALRAPRLCIFGGHPDFAIPLDLSGLATSRLTAQVKPLTKYGVETTRPSTMSDLDAEDAGIPNEWAVFLDPQFVHIDFIDLPDFVANLLTQAVDAAVDGALGFLPGWARDLIKAILGGAINILRTILGIPGDIISWLSHLIGVDLDLFDLITTALAQHFAKDKPLVQLEDPFPIMQAQLAPVPLIPVKIPVRDLGVQISSDEMVLHAKVGG